MSKKHSLDMTTGPFLGKILVFALPLILTGLLQLVYNTADVVVVGHFAGRESLAAVGSTGSLVNLLLNVFIGLSTGSGVIAARYIGAGDSAAVHRCAHTAMTVGAICGVLVALLGYFMSGRFLVMMKAPEDVLGLATLYLKIYFLGAPGSLVFNFGASLVRAAGDTRRPLYILTFTGLINVALNLLLVIEFGLGVSGVAIATIVSQYISAVLIVILLLKSNTPCRIFPREMRIHKKELGEILAIGLPAGIQGSLFSISNVIIQSTVNSFGSVAMAGIAAGSNCDSYIYTCTNAVAQTTMTFSSQNLGAKKYENIRKVYALCLIITVIIGVSMGAAGYAFRVPIIRLFSSDAEVIAIGADRLKLIMPFYFFCSLMDVGASQLRGMGRSLEPMIISLLGGCGIRILWIFVFLPLAPTLTNLYWSYPISWIITFFAHLVFYFAIRNKVKRLCET